MKLSVIGYNFKISLEAIISNRLRAVLTSLGIIFGVASVISMLAIGSGAEQEILEKMKLLGTNNIIINSVFEEGNKDNNTDEETESNDRKEGKKFFSPGLNLADVTAIRKIVPEIDKISPQIIIETLALNEGLKKDIKLVGVTEEYFDINGFFLNSGNLFNTENHEKSQNVCIIGYGIKNKLYPQIDPVGKEIKCGKEWLKIIGVLEERNLNKENIQNLGIRNYNLDVYIPINTMLMRYANRSLITKSDLKRGNSTEPDVSNYHQLDKIVVSFKRSENIQNLSEIISRLLQRRHNGQTDFEIIVPELLLKQEQETKRIFNIVLGAIASISLIVGGIGIMNIMLASVLERTKEIGIRLAVGARKSDIMLQFLGEAVFISLTGGIIGIILGLSLTEIIEGITDINTIISIESVVLSFLVSISVGLIFGITPAKRASEQNPITLLRYE